MGGSYASGALSAFVRVSRHKPFCYVLFCHPVPFLHLFLSNKHFQVSSFKLKAECKHIQRLSAINASFKKQIKVFMETMTSDDNICLIIIIAMVTVLANIAISNKLV